MAADLKTYTKKALIQIADNDLNQVGVDEVDDQFIYTNPLEMTCMKSY